MTQVVIENPVINSPFAEPTRHFRFGDEGITNELLQGRRTSSYFVPIAQPRKKGQTSFFETEWVEERIQENQLINDIRVRVARWRQGGEAFQIGGVGPKGADEIFINDDSFIPGAPALESVFKASIFVRGGEYI